jgi:hypothetical protein
MIVPVLNLNSADFYEISQGDRVLSQSLVERYAITEFM